MHINLTFTYQGRAGSCANGCLFQCSWRGKEFLAVYISSDDFIKGRDEYKMWCGVVDSLTMTLLPFQSQKECQCWERTYMNSTDFLCPVAVLLVSMEKGDCSSDPVQWVWEFTKVMKKLFCIFTVNLSRQSLLFSCFVGYFLDRVCLWSSICFYSFASAFCVLG